MFMTEVNKYQLVIEYSHKPVTFIKIIIWHFSTINNQYLLKLFIENILWLY